MGSMHNNIVKKLVTFMKFYGISRKTMSLFYGISCYKLNRILKGKDGFDYNQLKQTCFLLGIDMETLLSSKKYVCKAIINNIIGKRIGVEVLNKMVVDSIVFEQMQQAIEK